MAGLDLRRLCGLYGCFHKCWGPFCEYFCYKPPIFKDPGPENHTCTGCSGTGSLNIGYLDPLGLPLTRNGVSQRGGVS